VIVEPAGRDEFLALMRETYGAAMTNDEFDWWFDRNPAGPRILNAARDDDGTALGVLAMSFARLDAGLAAFAIHAVTTPASRGKGAFSALALHNEREAAAGGAQWALGFANPLSGPILVDKLGWEDIAAVRVWARPKRLRRRAEGGLRITAGVARSDAERRLPGTHIVRDPEYLSWRYIDSPRVYAQAGDAIVTHAMWHGFSSAIVCEGGPSASLRLASAAVDADTAIAFVNHGEERTFLAAGYVPTTSTIRFIGKRLRDDAPPIPLGRRAWSVSLGDLDFF
jgi:GNAT superfamily N-acetyltransferase